MEVDSKLQRSVALVSSAIPFKRKKNISTEFGMVSVDLKIPVLRSFWLMHRKIIRFYRESPLGVVLSRLNGNDKIFVDVGANLGIYTLIASKQGFKSIAIEPETSLFDFMKSNPCLFENCYNIALTNREGFGNLHFLPGKFGAQSLCSEGSIKSQRVGVSCFSDFVRRERVDPELISFIKIDVEGEEFNVALGMLEFLEEGHRPVIWCEVRGDREGRGKGSFRLVSETLSNFGYSPYDNFDINRPTPLTAVKTRDVFDVCFMSRSIYSKML